ncbi:LOW QUALITY PROTEIN: hypothetical protein MC885_000692 [Smutsia gigantea]|nr:LOW QUALITY PROTEIN: hypothetical protein MC885_000692 [Smutsia gigantea]
MAAAAAAAGPVGGGRRGWRRGGGVPGEPPWEAGAVSIAAAGGVAPGNFLVPGLGFAGILLEGEQWGGGPCGSRRRAGTCSASRDCPSGPCYSRRRRARPEDMYSSENLWTADFGLILDWENTQRPFQS